MSTLLITLPQQLTAQEPLVDCVLLRDDASHDARESISLSKLPQGRHKPLEIVAIVPTSALSWHRVKLPAGARKLAPARLRSVLEGALEDRVLDDPGQLHFALQPRGADDGLLWVAVCNRQWIRDAIAALAQHGHTVSRIVPEFAPLAADEPGPATLCFVGNREHPLIVCADAHGVRCLPASRASLNLLADASQPGWSLEADPMQAQLAEELLQLPVVVHTTAQRIVIATQTDWDLAQFELAVRSPARLQATMAVQDLLYGPRFRGARWALAIALVVQLAGLNLWAWQAQAHLNNLRAAMDKILRDTFPQVNVVINAPLQMERELNAQLQASGATSNRDLESILGTFLAFTPVAPSISAINFAANELKLQGVNLTPEQLKGLNSGLRAKGLSAEFDGPQLVLRPSTQP